MEPSSKINDMAIKIVNTKSCFFCLTSSKDQKQDEIDKRCNGSDTVPLRCLFRHLQINEAIIITDTSLPETVKADQISVNLCKSCEANLISFTNLFQKFEMVQMEVNYFLGRIHQSIFLSSDDSKPDISKKTTDEGIFSQFVLMENLRKEIANKSLERLIGQIPFIQLNKVDTIPTQELESLIKHEDEISFEDSDLESDELSQVNETKTALELKMEDVEEVGADFPPESSSSSMSPNPEESIKTKTVKLRSKSKEICYKRNPQSGTFHCEKCDKEYATSTKVISHYARVHKKYKCDNCNSVLSSLGNLKRHLETCGNIENQKRFKCDICKIAGFTLFHNLKRHKKTCRKGLAKIKKRLKLPFHCATCGKGFAYRGNLNVHHKVVHLKVRKFACDLCSKTYGKLNVLAAHKLAVHQKKVFYCRFCNRSYAYKQSCWDHERMCKKEV